MIFYTKVRLHFPLLNKARYMHRNIVRSYELFDGNTFSSDSLRHYLFFVFLYLILLLMLLDQIYYFLYIKTL